MGANGSVKSASVSVIFGAVKFRWVGGTGSLSAHSLVTLGGAKVSEDLIRPYDTSFCKRRYGETVLLGRERVPCYMQ
jgi:hypothetical protein